MLLALSADTEKTNNGAARIVDPLGESDLVALPGSRHPLALANFDEGPVADGLVMEHIYVVLRRSPQQEAALEHVVDSMQDPHSPIYHKWLTADELGRRFGPEHEDIDTVVGWLRSHGFQVTLVHKAGLTIDVSGTAAQVRDAFHTEIHRFNVNGKQHISNASDVRIPAALQPVVVGVASLNDFFPKVLITKFSPDLTFHCTGCPEPFTDTELYFVAPADFNTIYNVSPLYKQAAPITGKGQRIAVLEESVSRQRMWPLSAKHSEFPGSQERSARFTPGRDAQIRAGTARSSKLQ